LLLCFFFGLNYYSVKTFARSNNIISILKFLVPLAVVVTLFTFLSLKTCTCRDCAVWYVRRGSGDQRRGIIFAYLGLTPIISVASEVQNPQRTIPVALILSVVLSTIIYVLLQLAFLGSIPTEMLGGGWAEISKQFSLPYRDIAITLGMGWLAFMVVCDAIISPSGTGNIYMNATPRVIYGWAKAGPF
jgi:amino acid transporter